MKQECIRVIEQHCTQKQHFFNISHKYIDRDDTTIRHHGVDYGGRKRWGTRCGKDFCFVKPLVVIEVVGEDGVQSLDPNSFCSFSLPVGPAVIVFNSCDDEVIGRVGLEMVDQVCRKSTFPDVTQVLLESGEDGVICFSYVVVITGGAGDDIDCFVK